MGIHLHNIMYNMFTYTYVLRMGTSIHMFHHALFITVSRPSEDLENVNIAPSFNMRPIIS